MVTREELRQDSRARGVEKKKLGDERNEKRPLNSWPTTCMFAWKEVEFD